MENVSSKYKFTLSYVFHGHLLSFILCSADEVFYEWEPRNGFEVKVEMEIWKPGFHQKRKHKHKQHMLSQ